VDKLTQSILAKAFRGKLVPQDPNDEPASELLKHIQEERRKQEAEARPGRKSARRRVKN
jgi:type I restriction enzyme, S subunit